MRLMRMIERIHWNVPWQKQWRQSVLAIGLTALLLGCGGSPKSSRGREPAASRASSPLAQNGQEADDIGRFLAGMPGRAGGPLLRLEAGPAWKAHSAELNQAWSKVLNEAIPAIARFEQQELKTERAGESAVFYPFSGPDVLYARIFFPHSSSYVLVGLEPPGTLPTPDQIASKDLEPYLKHVRSTVYSELHRSFFITGQMDRQFRGQISDGLFPTILHLLVRTRHMVDRYRYVRLDQEGRVIERPAGENDVVGTRANNGVEIDFHSEGDRTEHKLYYFSVNLSDARLRKDQSLLKFLSQFSTITTYFKATSYLPHHAQFSLIRGQALDRSSRILQDDSGIPFRFFDRAGWRIQLYGDYDRPYGSFRWRKQPDLQQAYKTQNPKPLGFRIGYGFSRIPSNLLLALRTEPSRLR